MHIVYALPCRKTGAHLLYLVLAHAVHQQVGAAVNENRGAHCVVPVVIMCKAAERSLQTAYSYGDIPEVFAELLAVDYNCAVRALACHASCGVCVVGALSLSRSVVSYHGVDISCGHKKGVLRRTEAAEIPVAVPVGL